MRRPPVVCDLAVTVAAEGLLVGPAHPGGALGTTLAVVAFAAWALAVSDPALETRAVPAVVAMLLVFGIACAFPPRDSHDLWSYVMYGRTVAVHHASPYVHAPSAYPHDPFLNLVGSGWRGTRSVYGPLFTGVSAALAKLAGGSVLRARLAFQGLAFLAVVATLALLWIETKSMRVLAFVGLHPAVASAIVNGGHNDALVGLAVLAGVMLAARRRVGAAGVVAGLGMLVKASTGFGVVGIAVWLFTRNRRQAGRFLAFAAVTTLAGYLPVGSAALHALVASDARTSRASLWSPISRALHGTVGGPALVVVVILAIAAAVRFRCAALPSAAAAGALAAYLVAGPYVLPWYAAWVLPVAALTRRWWLSRLIAVYAGFLVAVYELSRRVVPGTFVGVTRGFVIFSVTSAVLVLFVVGVSRRPPTSVAHDVVHTPPGA